MGAGANSRVPNELRRERNFAALLDAGEELVLQGGYASTSIDRIATRARLTKGAFYFYFASKESLLKALVERSEATIFESALARLSATGQSATSRLVTYFNEIGSGTHPVSRYLLPVMISMHYTSMPVSVQALITDLHRRVHSGIEEVIVQGQREGEFRPTVQSREHAALVMALMDGMLLQWSQNGADLVGREFLRAGRQSLLGGLLVESTASSTDN